MRIMDWMSDVCSSDLGVPLRYRVTTRRIGRDGTLIDFALVYALQWQRTGRGYRVDSVLERIDSGAEPGVTRMLTMMLDPLVGAEISYLVPPDGTRIAIGSASCRERGGPYE